MSNRGGLGGGASGGGGGGSVSDTTTHSKLDSLLAELQQKFETGGEVALNAAALAALESITATLDAGSLAALESITVALDAGSLSALETITAGLDAATLSALETINAAQSGSWSVTADTELPAAGALADGASNPTTPSVGAHLLGYNGSTWDRLRTVATGLLQVAVASASTGGYTPGTLLSANNTNATVVKGSGGTLGYLTASNTNAAARYVKFYNKASAPDENDSPVAVFLVPGGSAGAGTNIPIPAAGIAFGTGISFRTTTGAANNDTGAVASNEIILNYGYK